MADRAGGLGARGRGEARCRRVRLHRRRRGRRVDAAREPRGVRRLADPAADAHRQRPARHLGRRARHALAGAVPARARRRALDRVRGRRGRCREGGRVVEGAADRLERRDALARAGRRDRVPALVPALLGLGSRHLRQLRLAGRGGRLRRDRRHARHAHARLAPPRSPQRLPAVHPRRGLRAVLQRPGVPVEARQAAGRGSAHRGRDDARDVLEPRAHVGRPRLAARADEAAAARQGRPDRRRRAGARSSTGSTA